MKLTMLGTGNAAVTQCYNTCFMIEDEGRLFMVDGGGGNTILRQIKDAGYDWKDVRDIFITHKHVDHLMGIIWMVRMICQNISRGNYEGEARMYGHSEVIHLIRDMALMLYPEKETKYLGTQLHLIEVEDGQSVEIIGHEVTFFDIRSTKAKQYGFCMQLGDGEKLTCCGDEPFNECERQYAQGSKWMLHEAFCLYRDRERFKPYQKNHSTVKDACELAEGMNIPNLVLYHTEDKNILERKKLYSEEGAPYYTGNLYIPEDLEVIML